MSAGIIGFAAGTLLNMGNNAMGGVSRAAEHAGNRLLPNQIVQPAEFYRLYQMGLLPPDLYELLVSFHGFSVSAVPAAQTRLFVANANNKLQVNSNTLFATDSWMDRALLLSKLNLSQDEILLMFNRGLIEENAALWLLKLNFNGESKLAQKYFELRNQIPGPSDLIAFAVRDCFDPNIVSTFEYAKELPVAILPWMEKQGLGGKIGVPMPTNASTTEGLESRTEAQWFDLYWWSHWQLPSVGQGYEMLHRLYKDSMYGPSPYADNTTYFTPENLELLQKANDFPTFWRKRLQAVAYTPLGRIDIRRMYATGILQEDENNHEVFHAYKQAGYNDVDAKRLTDYTIKKSRPDIRNLNVSSIDKLYKQGSISYDTAKTSLVALDYSTDEADAHLLNIQLKIMGETVDFKLKNLKRAFLAGDISEDEVRSYFMGMGLQSEAQERYLSNWKMQLETTWKHVSLDKAITLYKQGFITEDQLVNKMNNLRYPIVEQTLLIEQANREILITQAKQVDQLAKATAKQIQKSQEDARKLAEKNTKEAQKQREALAKIHAKEVAKQQSAFSEKNIVAFWKAGFLPLGQIQAILAAKGWDGATIAKWMLTYTPTEKSGEQNAASQTTERTPNPVNTLARNGGTNVPRDLSTP